MYEWGPSTALGVPSRLLGDLPLLSFPFLSPSPLSSSSSLPSCLAKGKLSTQTLLTPELWAFRPKPFCHPPRTPAACLPFSSVLTLTPQSHTDPTQPHKSAPTSTPVPGSGFPGYPHFCSTWVHTCGSQNPTSQNSRKHFTYICLL